MYVCTFVCLYMYTYVYVYIYIYTYATYRAGGIVGCAPLRGSPYRFTYMSNYIHVYVCISVCVYMYVGRARRVHYFEIYQAGDTVRCAPLRESPQRDLIYMCMHIYMYIYIYIGRAHHENY